MALNIQQVHENNVVAKKWLNAIVAEIKTLRKAQEEHESLPLRQRLSISSAAMEVRMIEDSLLSQLETMKHSLQLYFWRHYESASLLSKFQSPAVQFSTNENPIFHTMKKTYCVDDVPHPVNF